MLLKNGRNYIRGKRKKMGNKVGNIKGEKIIQVRLGITKAHKDYLGKDGFKSYNLRNILDEHKTMKSENEILKEELRKHKTNTK